MDTNLIVLVFFYEQLWWSHLSAEIKAPANSSTYLYPASKSGDLIKNERRTTTSASPSTVKSWVTGHQEPHHQDDGHLIAAVLIGVILLSMIIVIVGIFLWKRWRHRDSSVLHWAGRSPFADGDIIPEVTANKEPVHGMKRTSVLSLLPWKFNKDTQLLESDEGQLSESRGSLDALPSCGAEETVGQSSPTATGNSASSTSVQTSVCNSPSHLTDAPLQPAVPEPLDLPPPPNWLNEDLCPISKEAHLLEENAEAQCSVAPDLTHQNQGEESLLPPPPEEFI